MDNVRVIRAANPVCRRMTERCKVLNPEYNIFRDQPTPRASPLRINTLLCRPICVLILRDLPIVWQDYPSVGRVCDVRLLMISILKQIFGLLAIAFLLLALPYLFGSAAIEGTACWHAAKCWESTQGTVVASKSDPPTGRHRNARIQYEYRVNDRLYRSSRIDPSRSGSVFSLNDTDYLVNSHRPGADVEVFYNPREPADSLLYREFSAGLWVDIIACLMFSAFPLYLCYLAVSEKGRREKKVFGWKMERYEKRQQRLGFRQGNNSIR